MNDTENQKLYVFLALLSVYETSVQKSHLNFV